MIRKYKSKPKEVLAIQYTGDNWKECQDFTDERSVRAPDDDTLLITTLEGVMSARVGDYIIMGVVGEVYPCKPEIFKQTYEVVNDS